MMDLRYGKPWPSTQPLTVSQALLVNQPPMSSRPVSPVAQALAASSPYGTAPSHDFSLPQSPWDVGLDPNAATDSPPSEPFTWGAGGRRITQDEVERDRQLAAQHMSAGSDYSPIQSWAQGAARFAQGLLGGLEMRDVERKAEAAQQQRDTLINTMLDPSAGSRPSNGTVAAALLSGDKDVASLGAKMWEYANKPAAAPHYFQDNAGNEWAIGTDGQPALVHYDLSPKQNFIPDGMGGGKYVNVPNMVPNPATGQPTGMAPATAAPQPAIGAVLADPRKTGGGAGNGTGTFHR